MNGRGYCSEHFKRMVEKSDPEFKNVSVIYKSVMKRSGKEGGSGCLYLNEIVKCEKIIPYRLMSLNFTAS